MVVNHAKLGHAFIFTKDLARVVTLGFLVKPLILNKMVFLASNLQKLAGLLVNQLKKIISKNNYQCSFLCTIYHCLL